MVDISKLTKKRLGELLREDGVITEEHVEEALERQQETNELLGQALIELGHVTESDIARVLCQQFGLPYINAMNYASSDAAAELVPDSFITNNLVLPLDHIGDVLVVSVASVFDKSVFEELEEETGCEIQIVISTVQQIRNALVRNLGLSPDEIEEDTARTREQDASETSEEMTSPPSS